MIPCRFIPLYSRFEIYKEKYQSRDALRLALEICEKSVKVESSTVSHIQLKVSTYINKVSEFPESDGNIIELIRL